MTTAPSGPMTEDELDELADWLELHIMPSGGMSLEMLDGLLSALVVAPGMVMPSEYLPEVWGEKFQAWESLDEAREAMSRVMRLWNHIVWRVQETLDEEQGEEMENLLVLPPFGVPEVLGDWMQANPVAAAEDPLAGLPEDFAYGALWANGFLQGVSMRAEAWRAWAATHEDFAEDLGQLAVLSVVDEQHALDLKLDPDQMLDIRQRFEATLEIPGMLQQMYYQRIEDQRPQPIRRAAQPGRNDACPCGSGKKYKKCCGSGSALH